jgi:uncharacterized protein (TIGR02266 family)
MTSGASTKAQKRAARRFRRLTVRIEVEYQTHDDGVSREFATTLGAGGLFIESERPLARKSRIKLSFALPGCGRQHEIEGRVVWATYPAGPNEAQRTAGMGIQFTDRVAEAQLARDLEAWQPVASD